MVDSLNAEISLGTIRNMQEAIEWLGYTYLFGELAGVARHKAHLTNVIPTVRMKRNPFVYGTFCFLFRKFFVILLRALCNRYAT
jgi:antiviral helicase SLH1